MFMNMKRVFVLVFSIFLGMPFLSSCSNDDEISTPKDNSWYWGYFKGTIDGTEYTLENEPHGDTPVNTMKTALQTDSKVPLDSIKGMSTGIHYGGDRALGVTLYPLYKGIRYVSQPIIGDWSKNEVSIRITAADNRDIVYLPKEERPFRVEVISLTYADSFHPILEAKVDGILYNRDNPSDSIVVSGEYGTR